MNRQGNPEDPQGGIEWTHVFGDQTGYTWNPVGGCQHGCRWSMPDGTLAVCYAETTAQGVARGAFPEGFEHHYYRPGKLDEPLKQKAPAGIFLDSMSDLMGTWVPEEQILAVLDVVRRADWHVFMLLTKNAPRLVQFKDVLPPNLWVGVSMPPSIFRGHELSADQQRRMFAKSLVVLSELESVPVKWVSFEPLSYDVTPTLEEYDPDLGWAVIGAATNGKETHQPDRAWTAKLIEWCEKKQTPVFFKGNLDWFPWRAEFPYVVRPEPTQLTLF